MNTNISTLPYQNIVEIIYFVYKIFYYKYSYKNYINKFLEFYNLNHVKKYIESIQLIENKDIDNFSEILREKYLNELNTILDVKTAEYASHSSINGKNMLLDLREAVKIK